MSTLEKLLDRNDLEGMPMGAWRSAMRTAFAHMCGDQWTRRCPKGPDRQRLIEVYLVLKKERLRRIAAAKLLVADWYAGEEWHLLVEKGACEGGRVHLRAGRHLKHEAWVMDGRKHYRVFCGLGNTVSKTSHSQYPGRKHPRRGGGLKKLGAHQVTSRDMPVDVRYHTWIVERCDCQNCLRNMALHLACDPTVKSLAEWSAGDGIIGPGSLTKRRRPKLLPPEKPGENWPRQLFFVDPKTDPDIPDTMPQPHQIHRGRKEGSVDPYPNRAGRAMRNWWLPSEQSIEDHQMRLDPDKLPDDIKDMLEADAPDLADIWEFDDD